MTERDQLSARDTSSPATRTGASNALPSRRARNASVTSLPVRTTGGAAGTSMRRALSRPMASTMPVSADRVTARASTLGSRAATLPGIASTTSARRSGSTSAGVHRTAYDACSLRDEPLRRRRCRRTGTIAPRAASSTAHIATLPSQRTLGPTSSRTSPAPAATSHPSTSPTGAATAAALSPPGIGTSGCAAHGAAGASASARNLATSSASAVGQPRPPAQATTRPGSHDSCRRTTAGSTVSGSAAPPDPLLGLTMAPPLRRSPVRRKRAAVSCRWRCSASATTWSRSSPGRRRAAARCSSASMRRRNKDARHRGGSASRTASCAGVASSSASSST